MEQAQDELRGDATCALCLGFDLYREHDYSCPRLRARVGNILSEQRKRDLV